MSRLSGLFNEVNNSSNYKNVDGDLAVAVEQTVGELIGNTVSIEQSNEDVASLCEIAVGLDDLADVAVESLSDGGLDRTAAAILGCAVESQMQRLGVTSEVVPSQESFGGTGERVHQTEVAVESIGAKIKQIWETIKDQIRKVMTKIKVWWNKVTNSLPKLKEQAEALKKRADNVKGSPKEDDFELGTDANRLRGPAGKFSTNVANDIEAFVTKGADLAANFAEDALKNTSKAANLFGDFDASKSNANITGDLVASISNLDPSNLNLSKDTSTDKQYHIENKTIHVSDTFIGNKALVHIAPDNASYAAVNDKGDDVLATAKGLVFELKDVAKKPDNLKDESVKTLTIGDVSNICDAVIKGCDDLNKRNANYDKVIKAKEDIIKAADKAQKNSDKKTSKARAAGDDTEEVTDTQAKFVNSFAKAMPYLAQAYVKRLDQPMMNVISHFAGVSKAALSYCNRSLAQYSEED